MKQFGSALDYRFVDVETAAGDALFASYSLHSVPAYRLVDEWGDGEILTGVDVDAIIRPRLIRYMRGEHVPQG